MAVDGVLQPMVRRRHGQPLSLRCQFHGVPAPTVQWLKDGRILPVYHPPQPSRVHVSTAYDDDDDDDDDDTGGGGGVTSELVLQQTTPSDSGMYQCRASNAAGDATLTTWVEVLTTG